jgi:hypothetical protein
MKQLLFILLFIPYIIQAQVTEESQILAKEILESEEQYHSHMREGYSLMAYSAVAMVMIDYRGQDSYHSAMMYSPIIVGCNILAVANFLQARKLKKRYNNFINMTEYEKEGIYRNSLKP